MRPTPQRWQPGDTARLAVGNLQDTAQEKADFAIYYGIVCGPWLLLLLPVGLAAFWLTRRVQHARNAAVTEPGDPN